MSNNIQVINLPNTLKKKASKGYGLSAGIAAARVADAIAELAPNFDIILKSTEEELFVESHAFEEAYKALTPMEKNKAIERIAALSYRIEEAAGTFGYPLVGEICCKLCIFIKKNFMNVGVCAEKSRSCEIMMVEAIRIHADVIHMALQLPEGASGDYEDIRNKVIPGIDAIHKRFSLC